ncbi:MAG: hypothetical protein LBQ75_01350 [Zoogloeaceae bacterium]|jgi:GTPase Era involved in 16S rRNA processing|nr:hypothetical protein [Zoogloeaceae bacterium]
MKTAGNEPPVKICGSEQSTSPKPDETWEEVEKRIQQGEAQIVSLDPGMYKPWTPAEKRQFERIMCRAFGKPTTKNPTDDN